jgi:CRP/FNR family transcriptional regulator, cyclic AMP receptor protein
MAVTMSKDVIAGWLKRVPLFAGLSTTDLDALAANSRSMTFKKGARIFEEGATADCCFVLVSGKARVVLAGNSGAEILLQILTPPALVGEIALLDKTTRSASLVASEPCHLIRIPGPSLQALRKDPGFEDRLIVGLIRILRASDDRVRVIATFPSIKRVAWCLGRIARSAGRRDGAGIVIEKTSHSELAEMAGCTRETVSRALQVLKRKKYVSWDDRHLWIDVEGMQRYLTTELTTPADTTQRQG